MKALAIDFGGTHATCGLVENQTILAHETIHTDRAEAGAARPAKFSIPSFAGTRIGSLELFGGGRKRISAGERPCAETHS